MRAERSLKRVRDDADAEIRVVRRKLSKVQDEHERTLNRLDDATDDLEILQEAHDRLDDDYQRECRARWIAEDEARALGEENAQNQWTIDRLEHQVTELLEDARVLPVRPYRRIAEFDSESDTDSPRFPPRSPSLGPRYAESDIGSPRYTSGYGTPVSRYLEDDERSLPSSASSPPDWMSRYGIKRDFSAEYPTPSSCGSPMCVHRLRD